MCLEPQHLNYLPLVSQVPWRVESKTDRSGAPISGAGIASSGLTHSAVMPTHTYFNFQIFKQQLGTEYYLLTMKYISQQSAQEMKAI